MKLVKGLNYRQWQQRNTLAFKVLSKDSQKDIRARGYYNLGWERVKKSWELLSESKVISFIDHQLKKGDLEGVIDIVELESENANNLANNTIKSIQKTRQKLNELVTITTNKYSKV